MLLGVVAAATLVVGTVVGVPVKELLLDALVNVVEPALVAAVVLRVGGGRANITTLLGMGAFFVNIVPVIATMSLIDALISAEHLGTALQKQWSVTFVSEFLGMIVIAPMILAWTHGGWRESSRSLRDRALKDSTPELVVLFAGLVFTTHIVFGANPNAAWFIPALSYLCAPFLIWAALRFGLRSATLALAIFSLICYWHTARGSGPFSISGMSSWTSMLHMQAYLATVTVTTLFAAVLLAERDAAARTTEAWRRRHEAAIRASGNLLYELDPEAGTFLWDGDTRAVLGLDHDDIATVVQWANRVHPDDSERVRATRERLISGELPHIAIEYRIRHGNGTWITVGVNGYVIDDPMRPRSGRRRIIGFVSDISEKVHAEAQRQALAAQLRQAEKMEAVGRLAGGIAHDFNNILGAILGYGELAQARVQSDEQLKRYLDTIVNAGNRAKALVDQILSYSRAEGGIRAPVIVGPVATEVTDLLRGSVPAGIEVRFAEPDGAAIVLGDPTRLHQLLMNLSSNAVQAMPGGGVLEISVRTQTLASTLRTRLSEVAPGDYVVIEVKDTGEGIAPAVIDRIFEPFFTTKPAGRGTGLGLALVHSIVKEHGGAIDVKSEVGKGTTFTVWLPRLAEEGSARAAPAASTPGRGQVILIVDDEPEVLAALEEMLATLGFEPAGYSDSRAALEAFRADPKRFEAVISDEVMPSLTGTQLTVELRRIKPDIPVIIVSGYGGAGFETRALSAGANRVLKKPYRMQDIGEILRGFFGPG
jgi:PAS domain S-box-containing protein